MSLPQATPIYYLSGFSGCVILCKSFASISRRHFGLVAVEPTFIETVVHLNEDGLLIFLSWTISLSYENFQ